MTDFTKTKMAFAVGLLAVLFMLRPLMEDIGHTGFAFQTFTIRIIHVYYLFAGMLGLSAYFYALEMVTERSTAWVQRAGNLMYTLAMLVPPVYAALTLTWLLMNGILRLVNHPAAPRIVEGLLMFLLGLTAILVFVYMRRRLREQDRNSTVSRLSAEQANIVTKASGLLEAGLYDLVLIEAFRAIEVSLKKVLTAHDVSYRNSGMGNLIELAERHKLIGPQEKNYITDIRTLRNAAMHEGREVSRPQAEKIIDTTRRVVTSLDRALSAGED